MRRRSLFFPLLLAFAAACTSRPARFIDAPPVDEVADDRAIDVPKKVEPLDEIIVSESYLRQPVLRAMDPERLPEPGDVNAIDDVPRSAWFPGSKKIATARPPKLPLVRAEKEKPVASERGTVALDAAGARFEILPDTAGRAGLGRAGAVIASRLLRAIGYRTADVSVVDLEGGRRAVVRFPDGIDLGPTPATETRKDDANDLVDHADRRSLRALRLAFYWLGVTQMGPSVLRDVYVGKKGLGHVEHVIVDLSGAFGAPRVDAGGAAYQEDQDALANLSSLGLKAPHHTELQTTWPAIGDYAPDLTPSASRLRPPFEPAERMQPGDGYWIAKAILRISDATIKEAIAGARIDDEATVARLGAVLDARRKALAELAFGAVTPLEPEGFKAGSLVLRDEAKRRHVPEAITSYRVRIVRPDGHVLSDAYVPEIDPVRVALPAGEREIDVDVTAMRGEKGRPMHVYVVTNPKPHVAGVRH